MECEKCGEELPEELVRSVFEDRGVGVREEILIGYECPFCGYTRRF